MNRNHSKAVLVVLGVFAVGLGGLTIAGHLPAPTGLVCPVSADVIMADWDDVAGAKKYSVDVRSGFDRDGDSTVDAINEVDFGTGDRTDGAPKDQSDLPIPLTELDTDFDIDGTIVTLSPVEVHLKVKALHPGRGEGRQNGAFSEPCQAIP